MLKYVNCGVVFQEIPDEVTLSVNISNCPCHCPGCHSSYLWEDIGKPLDQDTVECMLRQYGNDITCISIMGGDADPTEVEHIAHCIKQKNKAMRVAWYSGRTRVPGNVDRNAFDYIKTGPYLSHLGPLKSPTTNQRLYKKVANGCFEDITSRFWKK